MRRNLKSNSNCCFFSSYHYELMKKHSIECFPMEACGLLGLKIENKRIMRLKIIPTLNDSNNRNSFQISKSSYTKACKIAKKEGLIIAGCFHSHPIHIASPSSHDIVSSKKYQNKLWLIYSVKYDKLNLFFMDNLPIRIKLIIR